MCISLAQLSYIFLLSALHSMPLWQCKQIAAMKIVKTIDYSNCRQLSYYTASLVSCSNISFIISWKWSRDTQTISKISIQTDSDYS
jgi:hypothetical protein